MATEQRAPALEGEAPREPAAVGTVRRRSTLWSRIRRERVSYTFILPGFAFFVLFVYVPLLGNVVAFMDFSPFLGLAESPWVGLDNFRALLDDPELRDAVVNTLAISFLLIVFAFPAPIALALLLNSLLSERIKRTVQTVVYLPHFLSWVIVISLCQQLLGGNGFVAALVEEFGGEPFNAMTNPDTFKALVVSQSIWKDVGWGTIIFFAAIAAVPRDLYEAAAVDGASAWRRTWHITLPALLPVTTLLLILQIGNVLTVGFEQLLLQQPAVGAEAAQVIDTFVYYRGVAGGQWGVSAAAGLLKGVIATVLIIGANRVAKRLGGSGIF
ncbi:ABC transporter permease subunit [Streptomyces sp. 3MP-14]|uniref:ABC transporter permease subunit n=1 Tax=Streptomyces mimosae TaxID=2586635 RepID=A0A5N6A2J8_9ACTN|nr:MULTISPECIES: ABC transporter permease subunit [Streptomyces]KAB8161900.1 ABC transporter permease subunit [Streptomyces mimosae]KAB8173598.1 ABC transporter permease subunit [Streptomyces sp. 3MP-14]